jgi:lysyl-tRNA synthetase class 2
LAAVDIGFDFLVDTAKVLLDACMDRKAAYEFVSVKAGINTALSVDVDDLTDDELRQRIIEKFPEYESFASRPPFSVVNKLIADRLEPGAGVRFLYEYPACTVCKAKRIPGTNTIYRFELFSDGLEIANAYLYEDDPADYEARASANGLNNCETDQTLAMLRTGELPGKSGILGIGIERLCSAATGRSLQDFVFAKDFSIL